jgi:hypothetical protein
MSMVWDVTVVFEARATGVDMMGSFELIAQNDGHNAPLCARSAGNEKAAWDGTRAAVSEILLARQNYNMAKKAFWAKLLTGLMKLVVTGILANGDTSSAAPRVRTTRAQRATDARRHRCDLNDHLAAFGRLLRNY